MRVTYPLFAVFNPRPSSIASDICERIENYSVLQRAIDNPNWEDVEMYTDEAEAMKDARARIVARDATEAAQWVPLVSLKPGAIFETEDGVRAVRGHADYYNAIDAVLLANGNPQAFEASQKVREMKM